MSDKVGHERLLQPVDLYNIHSYAMKMRKLMQPLFSDVTQ